MLVLLPPSETKKSGGVIGSKLDLSTLIFPELTSARGEVIRVVRDLAHDVPASVRALRLGAMRESDVAKNLVLEFSPVMPALSRYVGVLYDALDAGSLLPSERRALNERALIHSAMFGPVRFFDEIPDYRLSASSSVPGLSLKEIWGKAVSAVLLKASDFIVDARSNAYARLGPLPYGRRCLHLDVLTDGSDGLRPAPSHLNKRAKGRFARALARARELPSGPDDLVAWGIAHRLHLEISPRSIVSLIV